MAILTTFITSIVEMLILAGVSYGGIRLGKVLRVTGAGNIKQGWLPHA